MSAALKTQRNAKSEVEKSAETAVRSSNIVKPEQCLIAMAAL
jgi:hypothetical protein